MMGQTLSTVAMVCAVGSKSAQDMWSRLKLKFVAPNRQNILQLKSNLQNLKKGNNDIETYLDKIKAAKDALETVGVVTDDEDIVVTVLRGLPAEFTAIKTVIRAQFVSCSLGELKTLLKAAEIDIGNETQGLQTLLTAMLAKTSSDGVGSTASAVPVGTTPVPATSTSNISSISANIAPAMSQPSYAAPSVPPGFQPPTQAPLLAPISHQGSCVPMSPVSYGYNPYTPYPVFDFNAGMAGLFAGRGNSRPPGNFGNRNFNYAGRGIASPVIVGFNSNNAIGAQNNFTGFRNNIANPGAGPLTCQLCGKVGHGAKTCRTLSNYQQGNNNYSTTGCQYCGRQGHTAERCYFIIGFPGQQQQQSSEPVNGTAMLAASNLAPQFWLADTGATNHMTSNAQLIDNAVSYPATDTVQVGNGQSAGQNTLSGNV
ncbi:uncharacterized protein LOC112191456 [Rosa chinensis]|uniref:uncharacterized protein LOC112191456 n=1 Tax=Rosa chinensis TaxID=74649 RepID=UPI000D093FEB|nr:uncharacterized protein LOC112191456 [Rosa chinensis]